MFGGPHCIFRNIFRIFNRVIVNWSQNRISFFNFIVKVVFFKTQIKGDGTQNFFPVSSRVW